MRLVVYYRMRYFYCKLRQLLQNASILLQNTTQSLQNRAILMYYKPEAYLKHCYTCKIEDFAKTFEKRSVLDV